MSTMPEVLTPTDSGITFWNRVHLATVIVRLPFVIAWTSFINSIHNHDNNATPRRRIAANVIRWVTEKCSYEQIAFVMPSAVEVYKSWMCNKGMKRLVEVEELAEGTKVMWVGRTRNGNEKHRVVLYVPGGAFLFPLLDAAISFWHHVQNELEKESECSSVDLAILGYSPIPTVSFPTQIRQAMLAVEHILASGVDPRNLQIVGDTSGAHLILALLSHIVHPLDELPFGIRRAILPIGGERIRGVYLMSPWVAVGLDGSGSTSRKISCGLVSLKMRKAYANLLFADNGHHPFPARPNSKTTLIPTHNHSFSNDSNTNSETLIHIPYLDPSRAPGSWFSTLDSIVDKVYMSVGGEESMRDDVIAFSQVLGRTMKPNSFVFEVQEGGLCCDPYLDFVGAGGGNESGGRLGKSIINWLMW